MIFTISEIKNYLLSQSSIQNAISDLSEQSIVNCNDYPTSLNYSRTSENLEKYEVQIGLAKLKEEQRTIYSNSNGSKGKSWMALSPKWIDPERKDAIKTDFEIMYWVNYGDDDVYGWFTVEQIKEWLSTPKLKLCTLGGTKSK